ncbi:uncharacterized protein UV8b_06476 [Ustilaginoidea virens]|uniref:Uncharacterized protein n=1 Tax=Ustilaginoidea virens TaxID=1159556 RepID=A0A8E5HV61_USTVR|nr:uncharacterized protein UV8b_06476 [Ustilaginoidea virens]QUC22235.1 hypothetical protein UV8b_06476 [Ustilaginoidea virens]
MTAAAGAALIGGTIYATRGRKEKSGPEVARNRARAKRELGLGGAGIGGNVLSGGPEAGAAPPRPDRDPERRAKTTADSRDDLPSGGVGGGEGAGGASARRSQLPYGAPDSSHGDEKKSGSATKSAEPSEFVNSYPSVRAGKSTADRSEEKGLHDTRGISHTGPETPSKRATG